MPRDPISRRRFLGDSSSLLATGGLALSGGLAACRQPDSLSGIVDAHIHADFPDPVLQSRAAMLSGVNFSAEGLREEMRQNSVAQALSIGFETGQSELSPEASNPLGRPPAGTLEDVFFIAGVNPYRLDAEGVALLEQSLQSAGVRGLKVYLGYYPLPPDDDRYRRVYELAARHNVTVVFHTGDTYSPNARVRYAHPLPIDDVAVEFREVTFVLAHLGNPWTMDAAELVYKNPNVYGELSGFVVGDAGYFREARNREGLDHVVERIRHAFAWVEDPSKFLYGSDWPAVPMQPYLQLIKGAIDAEYHEAVFAANARRVFRLRAPAL